MIIIIIITITHRNFIESWKITNYITLHLNFKLLVIKPLIFIYNSFRLK